MDKTMAITESPEICPQCANGFVTKGRCGACGYRVGSAVSTPSRAGRSDPPGVKVQGALAGILYLASLLSLGVAVLIFAVAKSAVHEIQAMMCLLIAAVCFGCAAIVTVTSPRP